MCVDVTDNELAYLESVHLFVEILDHYFSNVCELDLVFNFHKVAADMPFTVAYCSIMTSCMSIAPVDNYIICVQVYLLLDEFIMGGELQETSKKVRHACPLTPCSLLSNLFWHCDLAVSNRALESHFNLMLYRWSWKGWQSLTRSRPDQMASVSSMTAAMLCLRPCQCG